ncbi:helix-turn-helix domain-containing protein [Nocardioides sp. BP30]|uniref:helix-turn-helix domain-containing protein n=1 Tax=Nocardioides sp. BP30 TaxID=3036374 RepID=UPI002469B5C3|nr:helix-turn-helix domain-containing protein [Nocardioides sp. BP30]WGL53035.1 helix-turn-helix domain-containing protein [Nocardioides sp. BP30]
MRSSRFDQPVPGAVGVFAPRPRRGADAFQLVRRLPAGVLPAIRAAVPTLPDSAAVRICAEVPAFAGPGHERLHRLVRDATAVALDGFVRTAAGELGPRRHVEEHFRGLGRAEVAAGCGGQRVLAAIQVASDAVWQSIQTMVAREELPGAVVADLGVAVSRYLAHLSTQVQHGMAEQRRMTGDARTQLVLALLQESTTIDADEVAALASAAGWRTPQRVVVAMTRLPGALPQRVAGLPPEALTWADGDRMVVLSDEARLSEVTAALLRLGPTTQVVQSWSVSLLQARHAYRWARRAFALIRGGVVSAEERVVRCDRYRMKLWLAADPALADDISQELLEPLRGLTPRRRLVLAETLQGWLETDESAPALARRLGVHANTVRGHLRVLEERFGEQLHDPQERTALILALEAALPRWRAALAGR